MQVDVSEIVCIVQILIAECKLIHILLSIHHSWI